MGGTTWTDSPLSPDQWMGDKNRINSFFSTWRNGTPRASALLLYGNPGCGKTSSVYAFRGNDTIIHRNCSSDGDFKKMEEVYEIVQSPTNIDGNNIILLLDEIEGLTHKSMELMTKIIKTTRIPIVLTCNMDGDELISKVMKYKWKGVDIFEVIYPEDDVVDRLSQLSPDVNRETLGRIASSCNSVRSAILTLHRFIEKGKLGKIIPIDIRGSEHEQIRKLLTGKDAEFKIEYNKLINYCLYNKVPSEDIRNYVILTKMGRMKSLGGVDRMFRNFMRSENEDIHAPKIKARVFFYKPKEKKKDENKGEYKQGIGGVSVRKKKGVSIDDLW